MEEWMMKLKSLYKAHETLRETLKIPQIKILSHTQHLIMTLPHDWLLSAVNHLLVALEKILIWEENFTLNDIIDVGWAAIYEALEKVSLNIDDDYCYYDKIEKLFKLNSHVQQARIFLKYWTSFRRWKRRKWNFPCEL